MFNHRAKPDGVGRPQPASLILVREAALHVLERLDLLVAELAALWSRGVKRGPTLEGSQELARGRGPEHGRRPAEPPERRRQQLSDGVAWFSPLFPDVVGVSVASVSVAAGPAFFSGCTPQM